MRMDHEDAIICNSLKPSEKKEPTTQPHSDPSQIGIESSQLTSNGLSRYDLAGAVDFIEHPHHQDQSDPLSDQPSASAAQSDQNSSTPNFVQNFSTEDSHMNWNDAFRSQVRTIPVDSS